MANGPHFRYTDGCPVALYFAALTTKGLSTAKQRKAILKKEVIQ